MNWSAIDNRGTAGAGADGLRMSLCEDVLPGFSKLPPDARRGDVDTLGGLSDGRRKDERRRPPFIPAPRSDPRLLIDDPPPLG